jgi:hypothetical protein
VAVPLDLVVPLVSFPSAARHEGNPKLTPPFDSDNILWSHTNRHSVLLLGYTISVRTPHDFLADVRTTQPRDIPRRLVMRNTAATIPATIDVGVVLPVLIIEVLRL